VVLAQRGIGGFRPRRGPTLFTAAVTLLCLALGVWQIQRLHWKEGLIAARRAALAAAPAALPQTAAEARAHALRRVVDEGTFLYGKEILVHAIGPDGGLGFRVLTPLREAGGRIVFVNRGFIPARLKNPAARRAGNPAGSVRVAGMLRLPGGKPGLFIPDNHPARGAWYWTDVPAMARADGFARVAPFYIDADATPNPGGWPKGGVSLPALPNHHLQYAITWFALAAAALVIYFLSQRRERAGRGEEAGDDRIPGA
jgi:surfeit locus 1 family protein